MKIIRHDAYIAQKKRNSKWIAALGFLMLVGTLFLAVNPTYLLPSYVIMLLGFVLFNMGMQQVGKWSRNPRNDQAIDFHLKSLPDRYSIAHYAPVGKKRIEHVLVHPGGAVVITAKEVDGTIAQNGSKWRRKGSGIRRFLSFSGPQLGSPSFETDEAIKRLEAHLAEQQIEVDVEGAVVFLHPQVEFEIESPDYPVLHGEELATFVTRIPVEEPLSAAERERLLDVLRAGETVEAPVQKTGRRRPVKRRAV
jgi:hypothetical protein